jgi:hypothetical protein
MSAFWDRKGVLMVEFMQKGTTMSEVNFVRKTRKNHVRELRTKGVES